MYAKLCIVLAVIVSVVLVSSLIACAQEDSQPQETSKSEASEAVQKLDINSAPLDALDTLPGIGPKLAQAIIDGRPYATIEAILNVKGIGEKRFEKIKDLIVVVIKDLEDNPEDATEEETQTSTN